MKMNQKNTQRLEIPSDAVVELDLDQVPDTDIVFECPHCGKSHAIDQWGVGLVIPCTDCRQPITVPAVGDIPVQQQDIEDLQPITVLSPEDVQEKSVSIGEPRLHVMVKVWGGLAYRIGVAVLAITVLTQGYGMFKEWILWRRLAELERELDARTKERNNELKAAEKAYETECGRITAGLPTGLPLLEGMKVEDIDRLIQETQKERANLGDSDPPPPTNAKQGYRVTWTKDETVDEYETLDNALDAVRAQYPSVTKTSMPDGTYEMRLPSPCTECKGEGFITCSKCEGKGKIWGQKEVKCPSCNEGWIGDPGGIRVRCIRCNGTGKVTVNELSPCKQCSETGKVKCLYCGKSRPSTLIARVEKIQPSRSPDPSEEIKAKICDLQRRITALTKLRDLVVKHEAQVRAINEKWDNDPLTKALQREIDIVTAKLKKYK